MGGLKHTPFENASVRPSVRECARACVQEPIAPVSVDFASPGVTGSKKKHIPFRVPFLPSNRSICCPKKGLMQKIGNFLSKGSVL